MIAYPLAPATAPPTATASLNRSLASRYQFARDRDRDRDREVLKSLHRVIFGLWLRAVNDLVNHHHSVTRATMMMAAQR